MPYITDEPRLPFQGLTTQSRHASHQGATAAQKRSEGQTQRYLQLLRDYPEGLTDAEAAFLMNLERTSINARRAPLVADGKVYSDGFRENPRSGVKNTVWKRL